MGWREPDNELGSGRMWLDENWEIPVLHFGSPPPVAVKEAKTETKKKKVKRGDSSGDNFTRRADDPPLPAVEDSKRPDAVDHPPHYNAHPSGVECITIVRHLNFNVGNAMKYLWRAGIKDEDTKIEDLQKAIWYLQDEIERLDNGK